MKPTFRFLSFLPILLSQFLLSQISPTHSKYVVGYYAQWAIYSRDYNISDIKAENLTHLMYSFYDSTYDAGTDTAAIMTVDNHADLAHTEDPGVTYTSSVTGNIGALKILKEENPHLNIIISVGGWTLSQNLPDIAKSANARKTYVESMVQFMKDYPWIDGFDVDWEFPVAGGTDGTEQIGFKTVPAQPHYPDDHKNFVLLLKEMRMQFDAEFPSQKKWVTMAGGNNVTRLLSTHIGPGNQAAHGVSENLADYIDFMTFFGYDLGGNWLDETSYNAPLYASNKPDDPLYETTKDPMYTGPGIPQHSVDGLVTLYLDYLKIPPEKFVMGLPFYGRLFEIDNVVGTIPSLPGLYESAPRETSSSCMYPQAPQGTWDANNCERSGAIAFADLLQGVALTASQKHNYLDPNDPLKVSATAAADGWVRYWDDVAKVPYLYNADQKKFISYDDSESIRLKVNYALERNLGGVMIWELSEDSRDEFGGQTFSNAGAYLLKEVASALTSIQVSITTTFMDPDDNPIEGVLVTLVNSQGVSITTTSSTVSGVASFTEVDGFRNYKITYNKTNYGFLPEELDIPSKVVSGSLSYDVIGSSDLVSLTGTLTLNSVGGSAAIILLDNNDKEVARQTSEANGAFTFEDIISGFSYLLKAEKDFYTFTDLDLGEISTSTNTLALDGTIATYTLSGTVTDSDDAGISDVKIYLTGGTTSQTLTSADGTYRFLGLDAGKNYTVTPSKTTLNFSPSEKVITSLTTDTVVDFNKNDGFIYGFIKDGKTPLAGITVQLILNYASGTLGYQSPMVVSDAKGFYKFEDQQGGFKISDYAAYSGGGKVHIPSYLSDGNDFKPSEFNLSQIPATPTQYDFNTQIFAPKITISQPSSTTISLSVSSSLQLEAEVIIAPDSDSVDLSAVSFEIDGEKITSTASGSIYSFEWSPETSDFNNQHSFTVSATASNGTTTSTTYDFDLECIGATCPEKIKPVIVINEPSASTYDQSAAFAAIPVEATVTDADGTVKTVTLSVNGGIEIPLTAGVSDTYSYTLTPTQYSDYVLVFTATDNSKESSIASKTIEVTNSTKVSITTTFKEKDDTPIEGVTVTLVSSLGVSITTISSTISGTATFADLSGLRNYKIAFSKTNYGFLPVELNIPSEIASNSLNYDVVGSSNIISLSGTSTLNLVPASAAIVLLDSDDKEVARKTSGANGAFTFTNIIGGNNYQLTAEKAPYTFTKIDLGTVSTSITTLTINGNIPTYTISGTVKDSDDAGISDVTIYLTGGTTTQTLTDGNGSYSFSGLFEGQNFTVTPSKTALVFSPNSRTITGLSTDTRVDFSNINGYIYGFIKDGKTPLADITAELILNYASSTLGYRSFMAVSDAKGFYKFDDQQDGFKISDYAAFSAGGRIHIPGYLDKGFEFRPNEFNLSTIPATPTQYDFNTQIPEPKITISQPISSTLSLSSSGSLSLQAEILINPEDETIMISAVVFNISGEDITATASGSIYSAEWSPEISDFNKQHSFTVSASASNGTASSTTFDFDLECSGAGCPNVKPVITINKPTKSSYNQSDAFRALDVEATITDSDGTVQAVTLTINGGTPIPLTASASDTYTYTLTPTQFIDYVLVFSATDNSDESSSASKTVAITNSTFVPLPDKVIVGYIHSWESAAAPFLYLRDVKQTDYNVVVYSFIETVGGDGFTPVLTVNDKATAYQTAGVYDKGKLKADIKELQDSGVPVLVSVGGQNGHVELNTVVEKDIFVAGVLEILREYGFDGFDIDFEGSSMNFGAGALTDFSYSSVAAFPKLKNVIDAINTIDSEMGPGFHITAAPEVQYVQQGTTAFADNWGSFLPIIHNIRDILDYIHVQLYNIGATNGVIGLDGTNYYQGTPDLLVSASESLIAGFTTAGPGIQFQGLRPDQVAIGLPATDACTGAGGAAGGGFVSPLEVTQALNYIYNGAASTVTYTGSYILQAGPYPDFRGAMTWSINWDQTLACG